MTVDNEVQYDKHGDVIEWFVIEWPLPTACEGSVLWDFAYDTKAKCEAKCEELRAKFPKLSFTPDDLPEIEEVFARDVAPVLADPVKGAAIQAALAIRQAKRK